jgi:hypothetical protein
MKRVAGSLLSVSYFLLAWRNVRLRRWRRYVLPKVVLTFVRMHGFIPHKTELFITITVRISKPTTFLFVNKPVSIQFLQLGLREVLRRKQSSKGRPLKLRDAT